MGASIALILGLLLIGGSGDAGCAPDEAITTVTAYAENGHWTTGDDLAVVSDLWVIRGPFMVDSMLVEVPGESTDDRVSIGSALTLECLDGAIAGRLPIPRDGATITWFLDARDSLGAVDVDLVRSAFADRGGPTSTRWSVI